MKTIIAGSRGLNNYLVLLNAIEKINWKITHVVSGTCQGADRLGERWARTNNISISRYSADWKRYGKKAGILRNVKMVENAEALLALWDGESRGTEHIITFAKSAGLKVYICMIEKSNVDLG